MGYYQRQILERLEHISGDGRARNPLKQENKSNSLHPYSFYGDLTEWKSLDQVRDTNFSSHDEVFVHRNRSSYIYSIPPKP